MTVIGLDHRGIRTTKLEATRHFYEDLLGLKQGHRPSALKTRGYWLYAGDAPVIHLVEDTDNSENDNHSPRESLTESGGDNHIAFTCAKVSNVVNRLVENDIPYWDRLFKEPSMYQVFVEDPNGILVELIERNPGDITGPISKIVE